MFLLATIVSVINPILFVDSHKAYIVATGGHKNSKYGAKLTQTKCSLGPRWIIQNLQWGHGERYKAYNGTTLTHTTSTMGLRGQYKDYNRATLTHITSTMGHGGSYKVYNGATVDHIKSTIGATVDHIKSTMGPRWII